MTVVDTFLFSESYEAELLLIKLHLESSVVDRFVLVESDVTFRGDFKGLQARRLVDSDPRFAPFRDRLTIIEHRGRLFDGPPTYETFYQNEERSRASAMSALDDLPGDTWVLVSDVDESVDATDPSRRGRFLAHLAGHRGSGATLYFGHYRFWYDFDNLGPWQNIFTPAAQLGALRAGRAAFTCRSRESAKSRIFRPGGAPLFFEYTFCFPADAQWKKLNSFIHDKYAREELDVAHLANHWVKSAARGERVGERGEEDWFDTVELAPQNSPAYVRDNLARLKTHAVNPDYRVHRRRIYGR